MGLVRLAVVRTGHRVLVGPTEVALTGFRCAGHRAQPGPIPSSDLRRRQVRGAPGGAPAAFDGGEAEQGGDGQRSEDQEAGLVAAGDLLAVAQAGGQVEAADAAGHADQASHDADFLLEALRHQLEDGTVAHPQRQHRADEGSQRHPGFRQAEADDGQEDSGEDVHHGQRLDATDAVSHVAATWDGALARHSETSATLNHTLQATLAAFTDTFGERAQAVLNAVDASHAEFAKATQEQQSTLTQQVANQLDGIASRFDGTVQRVTDTWDSALAKHEQASERLTTALDRTQSTLAATFAERSASLLADMRSMQAAWQSDWAAGEQARQTSFTEALTAMAGKLEAQWQQAGSATMAQQEQITQSLGETARDLVAATQRQAETTIAEVTRLMQTAAEAPKAAAEVIGQLRHELSASMARDNSLLEERSRIMETLGALLDAINHASTEQRSAIDALVKSSADLLERTGSQFASKVESEAGKLVEVGAGIAQNDQVAGLRHEGRHVADGAVDDDVDALHRDAAAGGGVAVDDQQPAMGGALVQCGLALH